MTQPDRQIGFGPDQGAGRSRGGGAKAAIWALGVLATAAVVAGALYAMALFEGAPFADVAAANFLAVAGSALALWFHIGAVYLLGRGAMRRRAARFGVKAGPGVSCYVQDLVLSSDPAAVLAHGRAAISALPQGAAFADEADAASEAAGEVVGQTGASGRSFGEIVRVRVRRTTAGRAAVEVESRPALWQLFDGAINAENVAAVVRYLEARAALVEKPLPAVDGAPAPADAPFGAWDWLALAYLAALVAYGGLWIVLKEVWPGTFALWAGWLEVLPLDPQRLLGPACAVGAGAAGPSLLVPLNLVILPTLLAYGAYNAAEFLSKRDRMDALNWLLCIGSLVFLPALVLIGCSEGWLEGLDGEYSGLIGFIVEESAGAGLYLLGLVIFTNGVSYLPALLAARLLDRKAKS